MTQLNTNKKTESNDKVIICLYAYGQRSKVTETSKHTWSHMLIHSLRCYRSPAHPFTWSDVSCVSAAATDQHVVSQYMSCSSAVVVHTIKGYACVICQEHRSGSSPIIFTFLCLFYHPFNSQGFVVPWWRTSWKFSSCCCCGSSHHTHKEFVSVWMLKHHGLSAFLSFCHRHLRKVVVGTRRKQEPELLNYYTICYSIIYL